MIEIRIIVTSNIFLPFPSIYFSFYPFILFSLLTGLPRLAIDILRPVYCNTIFDK